MGKEKLKIAIVMPWHISERGGGAEVQANFIADVLSNSNFQVSYICQTINSNKINQKEKINNITVHWLEKDSKFRWLSQNKYLVTLKNIKPDYVFLRLFSNLAYVCAKYSQKHNAKFHWICTGNLCVHKTTHIRTFFNNVSLKNTFILKFLLFLMNAILMDIFTNMGMKYVDIGWSQNDFQFNMIQKNFNLKTERIISGHPHPTNKRSPDTIFKTKTILWCANYGRHKRPELFIKIAKLLESYNYKFTMVGSHSDKRIVDKILQNKPNNLKITGRLNYEDNLNEFDHSSIFINTSSSEGDGFPNTFPQSWARGLPTITIGFDPDNIIKKNNLGYCCKDTSEVSEKIVSLLSNEKLFIEISDNVIKYFNKNNSLEILRQKLLKHI